MTKKTQLDVDLEEAISGNVYSVGTVGVNAHLTGFKPAIAALREIVEQQRAEAVREASTIDREELARLLFDIGPFRMPSTYQWTRQPKSTKDIYRRHADDLMSRLVIGPAALPGTDKENPDA